MDTLRTICITGATGGLGRLCAAALAQRGWRVLALGTNQERLKALGDIPGVIPIRADITSQPSLEAARQEMLRHTDSLQAVVNLAGLSAFASLVEGDPLPGLARMLEVNVLGMARVNRLLIDLVERGQGRIVNISSAMGWTTAQPFNGAYVASKRAVEGYNDSLRRELMFLGIPVIKIQPGPFATSLVAGLSRDFDTALQQTTRYQQVLTRLRPMMDLVLGRAAPPERFVDTLLRAVEAPRPRARYRCATGLGLLSLELLPEWAVDRLYQLLLRARGGRIR